MGKNSVIHPPLQPQVGRNVNYEFISSAPLHCWHNYLSTLSVSPALRITCIRQARFCTARSPILHSLDHSSKKFGSLSWCVLRHAEAFCHIRCYVSPTDAHPRVRAANFTRPSGVKKALCFICISSRRDVLLE